MQEFLSVGEVANRSGLAVSALHYYEREGLISSTRTAGNQRRYRREVLRRLAFVRLSQRVGIPLAEIRAALDSLPGDRVATSKEWARLSGRWKAELDARAEQIRRLRDELDQCVGCGCLSLTHCRLANPGDVYGSTGTGPRALVPGTWESE